MHIKKTMSLCFILFNTLSIVCNPAKILKRSKNVPTKIFKRAKSTIKHFAKNREHIRKTLFSMYTKEQYSEAKKTIKKTIQKGVHSVDVQQHDLEGTTPLFHAIAKDDAEFAEYLLLEGANPNFNLRGIYASAPIFIAKSVAIARLLRKYGAKINIKNNSKGLFNGCNLLHTAINCNIKDNDLFDYYLDQGLDPYELNAQGGNLWHSLIHISACECPVERFANRAKKLHDLSISPYEKDHKGIAAIDEIERQLRQQIMIFNQLKEKIYTSAVERSQLDYAKKVIPKFQQFLMLMKNKEE